MPMSQSERHQVKTGKTLWTNIDNAHPERATLWRNAEEFIDTDDQDTHDALLVNPKTVYIGNTP